MNIEHRTLNFEFMNHEQQTTHAAIAATYPNGKCQCEQCKPFNDAMNPLPPTPETDAAEIAQNIQNQGIPDGDWPWKAIKSGYDFARKLECQRDEARALLPARESSLMDRPWIGVDLDGTLAHYDEWRGIEHIGPPIEAMRRRVLQWLAEGQEVRILTARVGPQRHDVPHTIAEITGHIEGWCLTHLGQKLPVTSQKDYCMVEFWDDRCVQVVPNEGLSIHEQYSQFAVEMNQRLIDRQESNQAQLIRIEDGWREKLRESQAQVLALREAYAAAKAFIESHAADPDLTEEMVTNYAVYQEKAAALSAAPLPVVAMDDVRLLVSAVKQCVQFQFYLSLNEQNLVSAVKNIAAKYPTLTHPLT